MVSHCRTSSYREEYVNKLKSVTSLNIDIFGQCGDLKIHDIGRKKNKTLIDAAYQEIAKDYKFVLSLENSICKEHVTEKFFYALKYGILPITNAEDVEKIAPRHSYLHIDDFKSPEDLMKTLEELTKDSEYYNSYFWWNEFYSIKLISKSETQCKFCDILNKNDLLSANNYSNFSMYWNQCSESSWHKRDNQLWELIRMKYGKIANLATFLAFGPNPL